MEQLEQKWQFKDTKTFNVLVHKIKVGDVDDPDLIVGWAMYDWQQTEVGKYVMKNSVTKPYWQRDIDVESFGLTYSIYAEFNHIDYTYYKLRYE